jgi:nitrogen fixation protein NifX
MFKVAFATADRVAIYAIDGERARLVEVAEFPAQLDNNAMDGNESKLADKIATLAGCAAIYCLAVGGSAVRQLLARGIQPVRMESEIAIDSLLLDLRRAINAGGIAWIDRLVKRDGDSGRFERMEQEGWQE